MARRKKKDDGRGKAQSERMDRIRAIQAEHLDRTGEEMPWRTAEQIDVKARKGVSVLQTKPVDRNGMTLEDVRTSLPTVRRLVEEAGSLDRAVEVVQTVGQLQLVGD